MGTMRDFRVETVITLPDDPYWGDAQFRYNGSLTINVWHHWVEVDVITLSEPGLDNALRAINQYMEDQGGS